ncbi:MAG: hypothetical protein AAFX06_25340 [Planctomycetota bacterium]
MLALLLDEPYPWGFLIMALLTAAAAPSMHRWYRNHQYQIPLWHGFALISWIAIAHYANDEALWLFSRFDQLAAGTLTEPDYA